MQQLLDILGDALGLVGRGIAAHHLPLAVDQELGEVPLDALAAQQPRRLALQPLVERRRARPVDLAIIDGVQSVSGGEGPWIRGLRYVEPGVLIAGLNAVNTDAVATAVMGYDPRALRGVAPFRKCDNTLLLAEQLGVGSADLSRIEVAGVPIEKAIYKF